MGETSFRDTLTSLPKTIYSLAAASPAKTRHDNYDDEQLSLMESENKRPVPSRWIASDAWHARLSLRVPQALSISSGSQFAWITLYFFSNLSLTLYNKIVLVHFPFPYTLTALHALCGSIGSYILMERGVFEPRQLSLQENIVLCAFSVLYTVNIAVSNLSLGLVTVPVSGDELSQRFRPCLIFPSQFHQVVRAATPIFVMTISYLFLNARYSRTKLVTLIPVIAGVGFACVPNSLLSRTATESFTSAHLVTTISLRGVFSLRSLAPSSPLSKPSSPMSYNRLPPLLPLHRRTRTLRIPPILHTLPHPYIVGRPLSHSLLLRNVAFDCSFTL